MIITVNVFEVWSIKNKHFHVIMPCYAKASGKPKRVLSNIWCVTKALYSRPSLKSMQADLWNNKSRSRVCWQKLSMVYWIMAQWKNLSKTHKHERTVWDVTVISDCLNLWL